MNRITLLIACLVTLGFAAPYGMAAIGTGPAPLADVADDTAAASSDCDLDGTLTSVLASDAYAKTFAHYADEVGFVDLHVAGDGEERALVALFDLDARDAALPAALAPVNGLEVRVEGHAFGRLVAEAENAAADALPGPDAQETSGESVVTTPCSGRISPGARISTPVGLCSLNFLYTDQNNVWYAGSAGHCFRATGERASISGIGGIGTVVYRINSGVGSDFALIRIDSEDVGKIDPSMCHWGGPTQDTASGHSVVRHYGYGVFYDMTPNTRARTGTTYSIGSSSFTFAGTVTSGDSGSGARLLDGEALGAITHVSGFSVLGFAHSAPFVFGTTSPRALALAESSTGLDLTLRTAPLADVP